MGQGIIQAPNIQAPNMTQGVIQAPNCFLTYLLQWNMPIAKWASLTWFGPSFAVGGGSQVSITSNPLETHKALNFSQSLKGIAHQNQTQNEKHPLITFDAHLEMFTHF